MQHLIEDSASSQLNKAEEHQILSKSVDKLNIKGISATSNNSKQNVPFNRKTSLPTNALPAREWGKPKNWLKDKTWLAQPDSGIVEETKVQKFQAWIQAVAGNETLQDLEELLDWENNKGCVEGFKGQSFDPYHSIRAEKFLINHPQDLDFLHKFCGQAQISLSNGDNFAGHFEDGERNGPGILNFGLINKRRLELVNLQGTYEDDVLQGSGSVSYINGDKLICNFVNGVPNGPAKLFDKENRIKQVRKIYNLHRGMHVLGNEEENLGNKLLAS